MNIAKRVGKKVINEVLDALFELEEKERLHYASPGLTTTNEMKEYLEKRGASYSAIFGCGIILKYLYDIGILEREAPQEILNKCTNTYNCHINKAIYCFERGYCEKKVYSPRFMNNMKSLKKKKTPKYRAYPLIYKLNL